MTGRERACQGVAAGSQLVLGDWDQRVHRSRPARPTQLARKGTNGAATAQRLLVTVLGIKSVSQTIPPLARRTCPLIQPASGPARKDTAAAMSCGVPSRSSGAVFANRPIRS